jgi:2,5-diamino-6-(ribosylamino)-4(3H)-pyrimidinone 5'-phosphate reductase
LLPRIVLFNAVSVDGRIDGFPVDLGHFYGLVGHWKEDATLVGSSTAYNPERDTPDPEDSGLAVTPPVSSGTQGILVVPDSGGRVRNWGFLRQSGYWQRFVSLCARRTPPSHLEYLRRQGVDCVVAGHDRVVLPQALEELHERYGVRVVRVDSGGRLNGALLRLGLVDEVSVLVCPSLVGGDTPQSMYSAPDLASPAGVVSLRLAHCQAQENGAVWLRYEVVK